MLYVFLFGFTCKTSFVFLILASSLCIVSKLWFPLLSLSFKYICIYSYYKKISFSFVFFWQRLKQRFIYVLFPEVEKKKDCYSPQFDDDNLVSDVKFDHPSTSSSCYAGNLVSNPQNVGLSASMEQSGSESQKQHKGTICSEDAFGGSLEAFGTPAQVKMMPQNDRQQKISVADVMCSACKQLLFHPVVLNCGDGIYAQYSPLISKISSSLIENLIG